MHEDASIGPENMIAIGAPLVRKQVFGTIIIFEKTQDIISTKSILQMVCKLLNPI